MVIKREKIAVCLVILYAIILFVEVSKGQFWVFPPKDRTILFALEYIADAAMILLQLVTFSVWDIIERYYLIKKEKIEKIYNILKRYVIFIGILFPFHLIYCILFKDVNYSQFLFYVETSISLLIFIHIYKLMDEKPYFILCIIPSFFFLNPKDFPIFVLIPFSFYVGKALEIIPIRNIRKYYALCATNILIAIINRSLGAILWLCFVLYALVENLRFIAFKSPFHLLLCLYAIPCFVPIIHVKDPIMDWGVFATVFLTFLFVTMYLYFIRLGSRGVLKMKRNPMILYKYLLAIFPLAYFVASTSIFIGFRPISMILTMILGIVSIILAFRLFI